MTENNRKKVKERKTIPSPKKPYTLLHGPHSLSVKSQNKKQPYTLLHEQYSPQLKTYTFTLWTIFPQCPKLS